MTSVRSWEELLDNLEEELEGATPSEPFSPPTSLGPLPAHLVAQARRLLDGIGTAELEVLSAMVTLRQELALLQTAEPEPAQYVDTRI